MKDFLACLLLVIVCCVAGSALLAMIWAIGWAVSLLIGVDATLVLYALLFVAGLLWGSQ